MKRKIDHFSDLDTLMVRAENYANLILHSSKELQQNELRHEFKKKAKQGSKRRAARNQNALGHDSDELDHEDEAVSTVIQQPRCLSEGCILHPH